MFVDTRKTVDKDGGTKPEKVVQHITVPERRRGGVVCIRTITRPKTPPFVELLKIP